MNRDAAMCATAIAQSGLYYLKTANAVPTHDLYCRKPSVLVLWDLQSKLCPNKASVHPSSKVIPGSLWSQTSCFAMPVGGCVLAGMVGSPSTDHDFEADRSKFPSAKQQR